MPWSMGLTEDGRILNVVIAGHLSGSEVAEMTRESVGEVVKQRIERIMLDCSAAYLDVPIVDVYKLSDFYTAAGLSRQVRAALLAPKDGYNLEIYEFYEDVCRNRGYFVKLFQDEAEAWAWLREA